MSSLFVVIIFLIGDMNNGIDKIHNHKLNVYYELFFIINQIYFLVFLN